MEWRQGEIPDEWRKAAVLPLHKGTGNKDECCKYRAISLLSEPSKIYGKIMTDRLMQVSKKKVSDKQLGFRRRKNCVDQICAN